MGPASGSGPRHRTQIFDDPLSTNAVAKHVGEQCQVVARIGCLADRKQRARPLDVAHRVTHAR